MADKATYPPLSEETRETVTTDAAAFYTHLKEDTLRDWARLGRGPIKAQRVGRRLHWRTADLRKLLGLEVAQ